VYSPADFSMFSSVIPRRSMSVGMSRNVSGSSAVTCSLAPSDNWRSAERVSRTGIGQW